MAGVLKFKGKKSALRYLALPGETDWELWCFASPADCGCERTLPLGELSSLPPETRLALPVRETIGVALWLQTEDQTLFSPMIPAQLEKRGLLKDAETPPPFHHHLVLQQAGRSLIFVLMMSPGLSPAYCLDLTGDYDFSAHCRPLPMDGYTLWKEENMLTLSLTRGGKIAHLQSFPCGEINEQICRQFIVLHLRLDWEQIATEASLQFFLQGTFSVDEKNLLRKMLHIEPGEQQRGQPFFLEKTLNLAPEIVTAARARRGQKLRWQKVWQQITLLYLLMMTVVLGYYGWLWYQTYQLNKEISSTAPIVHHLSDIADHWHALEPAIDPKFYPLETLLSCVKNLPPDARLTQFSQSTTHGLIMGEAADAGSAFKFLNGMQNDPAARKWNWIMPQPQLLPSNRAQFQLEGSHGAAAIK